VAVQVASSRTSYEGEAAFQSVMQDVSAFKNEAENLKRTTENTITAMARLAEARDPYTSGHQERVAAMAFRIGQRMGLSETTCETIRLAGIVHDIGKMSVPSEILAKPGRLNDAEFSLIKEHAEHGYQLLLPLEFPWPIAEIVRQHHERLNGSGYPRGLEDGAICVEARVIAVADTIEAMSSHRPYRPALGLEAALSVVRGGRGKLYDPSAVDAALALASEGDLLGKGAHTEDAVWSAA
jgi:putative nucleotidyltransferase with HDIG domain